MTANTEIPLIMMVAQAPFETDLNAFCKLLPVVYADGRPAEARMFPNEGEIWWMLTDHTSALAVPGALVAGPIELAARYVESDPFSSRYQAVRESVQPLNLAFGLEIIELRPDQIDNIEEVVASSFHLALDVPPAANVMLHWRSHFYGAFKVAPPTTSTYGSPNYYWLAPAHPDGITIYEADQDSFAQATQPYRLSFEDEVSLNAYRRRDNYAKRRVNHAIVLKAGYERLLANNPRRLVVEPLQRKLQRFARSCLTRAKRKQLIALLDEIDVSSNDGESLQELIEAVGRAKSTLASQDASLEAAADALVRSGLLGEDRISTAEQSYAAKYIEERTAELQAAVETNLSTSKANLRRVEEELKNEQANLHKARSEQRVQLERDIASEREKALNQLKKEKEELAKQKAELERQQDLLRGSLEKVTKEFHEAGDEVVNRYLTIAPLLGTATPSASQRTPDCKSSTSVASANTLPTSEFEVPAYISSTIHAGVTCSEEAFFDRFRKFVEDSGFTFRLIDLQRFHLSVKCGDLTVLGGPSGTGKSSLPALYAKALLGNEPFSERLGCLMVNVNPSWMDARDLLGHVNTLDGRFYPAESGLFQHLVRAQMEYETRVSATGVYIVCLDEMNLSQVEHYFSDFMMVLERTGSNRKVKCFAAETATPSCPFRKWGEINISPAIRFVGTVNFDETTRLLSDRFLDRVNMIRLTSTSLPGPAGTKTPTPQTSGPMISLADLDRWCSEAALPAELGTLLDQMRPILAQMGCPISPRVYRAICRFVASSSPIIAPEKAFELQVAQRIVPRIRSLITDRQIEALDALMKLLNQNTLRAFEEPLSLLEDIRQGVSGRHWELEP